MENIKFNIGPIFRVKESKNKKEETMKMGPISCTETSVRNYHYSLQCSATSRRKPEVTHRKVFCLTTLYNATKLALIYGVCVWEKWRNDTDWGKQK